MKAKKDKNDYSADTIKQRRRFPVKNTVIISICVVAQILLIYFAVTARAEPQDVIEKYSVTVEPLEDGTLDIEYSFRWKAIDESEPLTWVEIGMANSFFSVYEDSVSGNIKEYTEVYEDGYTGVQLYFKRGYKGGENLGFSFKVNQEKMLCETVDYYFYEFVPCWFNSTPVEKYEFKWQKADSCIEADNAKVKNGYYTWTGSFECGEFEKLLVSYKLDAFSGADTVEYEEFATNGAYNQLEEDRNIKVFVHCILVVVLLVVEIYHFDSYISYGRGRGFLVRYGHPIHIYGYENPKYIRAYNRAHASTTAGRGGRGGGGGGCACACACACAAGGRAGCSQKDTYTNIERINKE